MRDTPQDDDSPASPPEAPLSSSDEAAFWFLRALGAVFATKVWTTLTLIVLLVGLITVLFFVAQRGGDKTPGSAAPVVADTSAAADEGGSIAPTEPAAGAGDTSQPPTTDAPDPVVAAAGVYRLSEASARLALAPVTDRFESAEGAIVVAKDGTVSGDFTYVYWGPFDDTVARVTADASLDPATSKLTPTEAGLTFEGRLVVSFLIEPSEQAAYTNPGGSSAVMGRLDLEAGVLELTESDGADFTSTFEFVR